MRIVIIGAGIVGLTLAKQLSQMGNDVVLIDKDKEILSGVPDHIDVLTVEGNANSETFLVKQGLEKTDLFIAVTQTDETNMISCHVAHKLGIPREKVVVNVDRYGNISTASIPVALSEANREGRLKRGDVVLMVSFGGGFTWGAALMRW